MPGGEPYRHERLLVIVVAVGVIVNDEPFQKFDGEPIVPLEVRQFVLALGYTPTP